MASILNATTSSGLVTSADNSGSLQLATNNGTTAVTIDTSQNVGIGTTSPTGKLDVSSSSAGVTAGDLVVDTANKTVYVGRQSSTGGDNSYLVVRGRLNGSGTNQAIAITGDTTAYGTGLFRPGNDILGFSTLATERMRISSGGNVFIKCTTTPSASVFGSAFIDNGVGASVLYQSTSITSANALQVFFNPNGNVGSVGTSGSNAYYSTTSDYRLKENIAPMTGALDKVALLKPCSYTWKNSKENSQGFIAHELAEVCPQAVVGEKDAVDEEGNPFYQSIDTSFLVATLTAAIQELKTELDSVKAELATLKGAA